MFGLGKLMADVSAKVECMYEKQNAMLAETVDARLTYYFLEKRLSNIEQMIRKIYLDQEENEICSNPHPEEGQKQN